MLRGWKAYTKQFSKIKSIKSSTINVMDILTFYDVASRNMNQDSSL